MDDNEKEYEVGYGKPPQRTQFVKGKSGNPRGRPKGSRNLATLFDAIASKPVTINEGGRTRVVSKKEAIVIQLVNSAAKGDRHSRREFLNMASMSEAQDAADGDLAEPHERDQVVFSAVFDRLMKMAQSAASSSAGSEITSTDTPKKENR